WARELFGIKAALLALLLYTFSPNIIAHSRYITTDIGVVAFYFITAYYLYKFIRTNSVHFVILSGIFLGLAEASKFNAIMLIPVIVVILLVAKFLDKKSRTPVSLQIIPAGIIIFSICALIIFASYFGAYQKPIYDHNVQKLYSQLEYILTTHDYTDVKPIANNLITFADPRTTSGQYMLHTAAYLVIPAYPYVNGFLKLYFHNYTGHLSYLLGDYSDFGWWYYFPVAYAAKTPLSELLLFMAGMVYAAYVILRRSNALSYKEPWLYCTVIPPLFYFAWSMTGHINLGVRHVLIIEPFVFIIIALVFHKVIVQKKKWLYAVVLLIIAFQLYSVIKIYPNFIAYFNEAAGGPKNGHSILVDSNIDWGQDAKKLKTYMTENSIDHVCMSYFGQAPLEYYGINNWYLPDNENIQHQGEFKCVVAISITSLYSEKREYEWLLRFQPTATIGYSINIYDFRKSGVIF
ncbi:MAG: glycosyltransferase family 39 protein, partial [Patescibacteria group bacterium]